MLSIDKKRRKLWKRSSENLCTGINLDRVQMSASKASVDYISVPKCSPAQRSIINRMQLCIDPKLIIRTRWKFLSKRRHPHLIILLSRCCLFQYSKIILNSAFDMLLMSMLCFYIIDEIWYWPFSAWLTRSGSLVSSVLLIAIQMTI